MNEKLVKVDIDFNEALRRIANTPKAVVPETKHEPKKKTASPNLGNAVKSKAKSL